jgi:hypothetical protein
MAWGHEPSIARAKSPSKRQAVRSIALIFLGYSVAGGLAISIFFLFVDITTAMEGSINGDFCSTFRPSGFGVPVAEGYTCVINFDYVLLLILYFPVCVVFWQTMFGGTVLASVALSRKCRKLVAGAMDGDGLCIEEMFPPIAIASTVYVLGVFILSGVYVLTRVVPRYEPSWRGLLDLWPLYLPPIDVFYEIAWLFLLPPVPIFIAIAYLLKQFRR